MRLIFCFLMASLMALAQTTGGSLSGSVTDSAGRSASGIEITAKHQLTGREYRTVSASIGTYAFPDLDPGLYTVTAKNGSTDARVSDVAIEVATRYLLNLSLQQPQQAEGFQRARNTLIEGATSEIGTFVQPKFFQDAPLFVNGRYRNPETFVQYLPGVASRS